MVDTNKDVDLYAELEKTLQESEVDDTSGASAEKIEADKKLEDDAAAKAAAEAANKDGEGEMSEEEISKLSPRAQKRIRDLAEELKTIKDKKPADGTEKPKEEEKPKESEFETVEDFLSAVQDEASRKLLETFAKVLDKKNSSKIAPLIEANAGKVFDEKFKEFEAIKGISDHKDDLRKTFMRNPIQSLKALIGEKLVDLQGSAIKPIEKKPSTPSHEGGKVDLSGLSKDELYDRLETLKE